MLFERLSAGRAPAAEKSLLMQAGEFAGAR
jgi:hypothetical protein